jgi:hypothetical protein
MAGIKDKPKGVLPGVGDALRVVPVYTAGDLEQDAPGLGVFGVAPAPPAQLTYEGGPLLTGVEVFTIFWGSAWQNKPLSDLSTQVNAFFDFVLTSKLLDQMSEYSVPGMKIGHGKRTGTTVVTTPQLHHSVSDNAIRHMLQHQISTNAAIPQPTANTLYFIYMPPGVAVAQGGTRSCQSFCGYHDTIGAGQIYYAVMPFPGCVGCTGGLSTIDALTSTSSHELCEAITDPVPGRGWYDLTNNAEIGDLCPWKTKKLGNYMVQLEWSNKKSNCV